MAESSWEMYIYNGSQTVNSNLFIGTLKLHANDSDSDNYVELSAFNNKNLRETGMIVGKQEVACRERFGGGVLGCSRFDNHCLHVYCRGTYELHKS